MIIQKNVWRNALLPGGFKKESSILQIVHTQSLQRDPSPEEPVRFVCGVPLCPVLSCPVISWHASKHGRGRVFLSRLAFLVPAIIPSDSQPQGLGGPLGFAPPHCPSRRASPPRPPCAPSHSHLLSGLRPGLCGLCLNSCRSLWSRPALHSSPWTTSFWGINISKSTAWNLFKMLFHSPSLYSVKDKNKGLSFGVKNSPAYLQKGVIVYPLNGYLLSSSCMPDTGLREGLNKGQEVKEVPYTQRNCIPRVCSEGQFVPESNTLSLDTQLTRPAVGLYYFSHK